MLEPKQLVKSYSRPYLVSRQWHFARVSTQKVETYCWCLQNSGGWGSTMGSLWKLSILQDYPSMLDKPWREAAALRLNVRTRKENEGRRIETIKEISVSPMWQPDHEPAKKELFQKNTVTSWRSHPSQGKPSYIFQRGWQMSGVVLNAVMSQAAAQCKTLHWTSTPTRQLGTCQRQICSWLSSQ